MNQESHLKRAAEEKLARLKNTFLEKGVSQSLHFDIEAYLSQLQRLIFSSDYWFDQMMQQVSWLPRMLQGRALALTSKSQAIDIFFADFLMGEDDGQLYRALRQFRNFHLCSIITGEVLETVSIEQSMAMISYLASGCIEIVQRYYERQLSVQYGVPCNSKGEPIQFIVLGMGKLGADELNLSSDIDLIFAYEEEGGTQHKESSPSAKTSSLSAQEFFIKLSQKIIRALSLHTEDGFVYRVDMRLRPFGASGPLASSFQTMLDYYREEGRPWERYAMLKASIVSGDLQAGARFLSQLRPFIYRKYTDFSTLNDLREMKQLISREMLRKDEKKNIKLGIGGIREIEFIVQAMQLVHGGRNIHLQRPHLLPVLDVLVAHRFMTQADADVLKKTYLFLRKIEHRLQAKNDLQTHHLPENEQAQILLAWSLGFQGYDDFFLHLKEMQQSVHECFEKLIVSSHKAEQENPDLQWFYILWQQGDHVEKEQYFPQITEKDYIYEKIKMLHDDFRVKKMSAQAKERLDQLMPPLLYKLHLKATQLSTFDRVFNVIESILRRSVYLSMLVENPDALDHLVVLCEKSIWIADKIAELPLLLDELSNASQLFFPPKRDWLEDELRQLLLRLPESAIENQMEVLRQFKHIHILRVAAADLAGHMHIMKVSDYLSWLAEICIRSALNLAWNEVCINLNVCLNDREAGPHFAVIAYGKLGGIELAYESDLDLVFLYDSARGVYNEKGNDIEASTLYTKLAQKMIHVLTAKTYSGSLYDVDMRLRPSGNAGLLVSSCEAFRTYQLQSAWVWEHQALVRSRAVAGSLSVGEAFLSIRKEVLCLQRDPHTLLSEVVSMRQRMLDQFHLEEKISVHVQEVHLKQSRGGMIDIEFMIQFLALKNAAIFPRIVFYSDNVRILDAADNFNCLPRGVAAILKECYLSYREMNHHLSLQKKKGWVDSSLFAVQFDQVQLIWRQLLEESAQDV